MNDVKNQPSCYEPEKDTIYPLCIGDKEECKHCCLSVHYTDAGWPED